MIRNATGVWHVIADRTDAPSGVGFALLDRMVAARVHRDVDHPSFIKQSFLATQLGLNLVERADLVVRKRRLWLRSLAGFEPIDVLFRRLEDDRIDPMEVNTEGGVGIPGLLLATSSGGVRLANAHGSLVIEDLELAECWETAGEWLASSSQLAFERTVLRKSHRRFG